MIKYTCASELRNTLFKSPFDNHLDPNNRWMILERETPWDAMASVLMENMSHLGRGSIDLRYALGALLVKVIEDLSDEETILYIQENIYCQYFVGLRSFQTEALFTPEVFVSIRKRLGEQGAQLLNDIFLKHCHDRGLIRHRKEYTRQSKDGDGDAGGASSSSDQAGEAPCSTQEQPHRGQLLMDATVFPQDIAYPLDTKLLNNARLVLEGIIDTYHARGLFGEKKPRTYRRNARKAYLRIAKQKRPTKRQLKRGIKHQLQYIRRNLGYLDRLFDQYEQMGNGLPSLSKRQYRDLLVVREVYRQQALMYKDGRKTVPNRIVSIAQPYVRPIKRGKAGKRVEFGAKSNVSSTEGYLRTSTIDFNNFNESMYLITEIEAFKALYGHYPASVLVDKIYLNRKNRKYLKEKGIKHYGVPLGRPVSYDASERRYRQQKQNKRSRIEGHFGLGKRKYGLENILMSQSETSKCHIALSLLGMNIMRMLRDVIFFVLSGFVTLKRSWERLKLKIRLSFFQVVEFFIYFDLRWQ